MKEFDVKRQANGVMKKTTIRTSVKKVEGKTKTGNIRRVGKSQSKSLDMLNQKLKNSQIRSLFKPKLKIMDLVASVRQLSIMTDAGIPIHDSVKEVADTSKNLRVKEIFNKVSNDLNAGMSLSVAFSSFKEELGDVFIAMVGLGENTGKLGDALAKLDSIMTELYENNRKFKKAMRYPMITVFAIIVAFIILMVVVVPQFREIFEQLNAQLPMPTIVLLAIEHALSNYGLYMLAGLIGLFFVFRSVYKKNKAFHLKCDRWFIKVPVTGPIILFSSMYRFNMIFSELVRAGVPIAGALDTSLITVSNTEMKRRLQATKTIIQRGQSLTEAFKSTSLYENMLIQMVSAGEQSGRLDDMLEKVTDYYRGRFNDRIDNISSSIEPILMLFIAGMVLMMALGIFLPMWDLGSAVKS